MVSARGARLRVHRGAIVVESVDGGGRSRSVVPIAEVDRIVIVTSQVSITSSAVRRLARLGIDILFLDARGNPVVTLTPPWVSRTSETRIAQYRAATDPSSRLAVAKSIVYGKMLNQAGFLRSLALERGEAWLRDEAERIEEYARRALGEDSVDRLRVLEAHAARRYWGALAALLPGDVGFQGRNHDSPDPMNTILNYLYALLYAWVHRYLVMYGLDPYVGFIHADRSGRPTLVYDFAELFRVSAVDRLAYKLLAGGWRPVRDPQTGLMDAETRSRLVAEYARWVRERVVRDGATGKSDTLERHMARHARLLAQAVRSGSMYAPFREAVR
ncbi:CRISPR-associated endonuclease Cas1 [Pyrolobus fumarii]|uniref:CRISPR-associated endonuclease Cas1 n=1 Tax=Pyrolobus fumarii TaxID=54252 RepID=UPI00068B0CF1|nr:CRISPR-associated endonuclease Cas1 [Pyrolobus fumarii]